MYKGLLQLEMQEWKRLIPDRQASAIPQPRYSSPRRARAALTPPPPTMLLHSRPRFCHLDTISLRHGDGTGAAALVALGGNDLVVVRPELKAVLGPRVEVGADVDRARGAMVLANGPELVKGAGALDGRLVDAAGLSYGIGAAVLCDGAELGGLRRGVVVAERLDDVVLDQRVLGPTVDGQIAVALRAEGAREVDGAGRTRLPVQGGPAGSAWIPSIQRSDSRIETYQPLPPTKLPQFCQLTLYEPAAPFW